MGKSFYRFRNIKSLLEFEELEKQTIYFAPPEDLNDPMEGFKDIVWNGDEIVWKNLFKNYLLCLEHATSLFTVIGEEHGTITESDIPVFKNHEDFPTIQYKELFEEIKLEFFKVVLPFIKKIATRTSPIRRDELSFNLKVVHSIALDIIIEKYEEKGFIPKNERVNPKINKIKQKILTQSIKSINFTESMINKESVETLFAIFNSIQNDIQLNNNLEGNLVLNSPNKNFIFFDFIDGYINSLEKIMYPQWYTACFMTECKNSSVWGHYGDNHKGICLIFEKNDKESLDLHGKIGDGSSGPIFGNKIHKFNKISYEEGFIEIDFFKSIGRLPTDTLIRNWFMDENNNCSDIYSDISTDLDGWRKKHWEDFRKSKLIKTKDWEYENEYRLILSSLLDYEIKKEYRILKYNFNSLKGLIFGIKTPIEDKRKIIKIIQEKCKKNKINDFELYQAYYSHKDKNIQHRKISFLNLTLYN